MTNWKAMQAYKGLEMGSDIKPRYVAGGSWRADLAKGGTKRVKSSGAASARGKR